MLHRQVFVLHLLGAGLRLHQGLFHVGGDVHLVRLPAGAGHPRNASQRVLQGGAQTLHVHAALLQKLRNQRRAVLQQGAHQMLLIHLHMLIFHRNGLGALQRLDGLLRKLIHVHGMTSFDQRGL